MPKLDHLNHSGITWELVGDELRATVTGGEPGEEGGGLPPGGTTGQVSKKQSSADYDIIWADEAAGVVESVAGGAGFVNVSAVAVADVITLDLANSRVFHFLVDQNITGWSFTNAPAYTATSPVIRIVFKQDATGGRTISGGPTLTFRDRRSTADFNTAANGVTELHIWHDGTELVAAIIENGRLDLEPHVLSFPTNGTQGVLITQDETLDLGDVGNAELDGTEGTGTLSFKRNSGADLALEPQDFEAGQVLTVTMASSTTASAVSIPRWLV